MSDQMNFDDWRERMERRRGDIQESRRQRDAGIAQVLGHTYDEYKEDYRTAFWSILSSKQPFNNEEILAIVGPPPNHPNASGALFNGCLRQALKDGSIQVYDAERQMAKISSHARSTKLYIAL
jgi:hypothetical protein